VNEMGNMLVSKYRVAAFFLIAGAVFLGIVLQEGAATTADPATITVSAAANLTQAFEKIGAAFEAETGIRVIFNFGSSGQLTEQIRQGAAVDVFAAANADFVDQLEQEGLILPDTKALYAQGRITIWTRQDSTLKIDQLEDLTAPAIERIAIANPEYAPYGQAAQEALEAAGLWETIASKLVLGENVAQTLSYAQIGEVDAAIVALSLSTASEGRWVLVPAELHKPLNQALAVISDTHHETEARVFTTFVNSPQGRAIMKQYGFILPGNEPLVTR